MKKKETSLKKQQEEKMRHMTNDDIFAPLKADAHGKHSGFYDETHTTNVKEVAFPVDGKYEDKYIVNLIERCSDSPEGSNSSTFNKIVNEENRKQYSDIMTKGYESLDSDGANLEIKRSYVDSMLYTTNVMASTTRNSIMMYAASYIRSQINSLIYNYLDSKGIDPTNIMVSLERHINTLNPYLGLTGGFPGFLAQSPTMELYNELKNAVINKYTEEQITPIMINLCHVISAVVERTYTTAIYNTLWDVQPSDLGVDQRPNSFTPEAVRIIDTFYKDIECEKTGKYVGSEKTIINNSAVIMQIYVDLIKVVSNYLSSLLMRDLCANILNLSVSTYIGIDDMIDGTVEEFTLDSCINKEEGE